MFLIDLKKNIFPHTICRFFLLRDILNTLYAFFLFCKMNHVMTISPLQVWQRCNFLLNSNGSNGFTILFEGANQLQQQQQQQQQYTWILGHPVTIKKCVTDMLNPIAQHHSIQFITAIGSVWGEKRKKSRLNQEHRVIIELVRSLKSFPLPVIVQNITEILRQHGQNSKDKVKQNKRDGICLLKMDVIETVN